MDNSVHQFTATIAAAGMTPPDTIEPGRIHRFPGADKGRGNMAGRCFMFPDMRGGWYLDHSNGGEQINWQATGSKPYSPAERAANMERSRAASEADKADKAQQEQLAALQAQQRFAQASTACDNHPYLVSRGVKAYGIRQEADMLLIPMRDETGNLCSLETIGPDFQKRRITGGRVKGCYHAIGKPNGRVVLCEGYSTGASIHEATGKAVAVAFGANNLELVARTLRMKHPALQIVLAADDDWKKEPNTGMQAARAAALAVGGLLAVPVFGEDRPIGATDFNDVHRLEGLAMVKACIDSAKPCAVEPGLEQGDADAWPEPREVKADLPPAPAFDAAVLLPKELADFVLDEADRMPCAPDYVASALLVALGAVIGTKCAIKPKRRDDWIVTPNLYGGVVGDPSSKKTPGINTALRFLDRLEAKENELLQERLKVFEVEVAAFEAHQAAVKQTMKKAAGGKSDPQKMQLAMADMQSLQPPEEPHARRFKSNDATTEKLGDLLSHNQMGMLVFRDELIGLLASWDKEGREGDKAFYLEGWNGTGSFSIDRVTRGSLYIKCLCLSVFGGIQPDLLERYLSGITNSLDNDGRIQRFQVLVYPDPVAWEWRDRYPVKGARESVRDLFDRLASFDPLQDGAAPADDFVKLAHFHFDDAAQLIFIDWATELHRELIAKEQNPLMQQHLGKFEKLFCAVALILHLAEGNIGPVKVDSALRAAAWCEYLAGHARRIYGMVEVGKINTAKSLGRRIAKGKLQNHFTARDVSKKGWANIGTTAEAENALSVLEEFGHVKSYEAIEQPGRPTTRYQINPKIKEVS